MWQAKTEMHIPNLTQKLQCVLTNGSTPDMMRMLKKCSVPFGYKETCFHWIGFHWK